MPVGTDYTPQYVELDDIPISGPGAGGTGEYDAENKRLALFHAEASLEVDVNAGDTIASGDLTNIHRSAVMNLATHVLTHAAEDPSDITIGDMASGGGTITQYSSRYLDEYQRLVDRINDANLGGTGDVGDNFSVAVNSTADGVYDPT